MLTDLTRELLAELAERPATILLLDDADITAIARLAINALDADAIENAPHVCPGCYAVGEERCAPGCIDSEIEEERRHAIENGDYGVAGDSCGYGNECGRLGCPGCQE